VSIIPALDLRPANELHPNDPAAASGPPANIEAEHALLGAVLYDNEALHLCEGIEARHFFDPFHGRLWAWMAGKISKGALADPMLASQYFERDAAFEEVGGIAYLARLIERAPPAQNAPEYARHVVELAQRRDLLKVAAELLTNATEAVSVEDAIGAAEAGLLALRSTARRMEPVTAAMAAARVLEALDNPQSAPQGVRTGIEALDAELGPLLPGDLILGAGRPGMGKSAGASCIALNVTEQGFGAIEINGEMTDEQMVQRHLSDICHRMYGARGPKYSDIRKRAITPDQRAMLGRAHEHLQGLPLVMLKRAGLKLSQLRSIVRRQASLWARQDIKLGLLVIDHMGLVKPDHPVRDRYEAQTLISNATKELAEELGCPIMALNQLNRETEKREDKRPQLADLRDSGAWEQDADYVIGWYREAYYAQRQAEPKGGAPGSKEDAAWAEWDRARRSPTIEAIILKARAGACSTVKLWGDVARNAIRSHAPDDHLL
jgi:Replicative DNA helicase